MSGIVDDRRAQLRARRREALERLRRLVAEERSPEPLGRAVTGVTDLAASVAALLADAERGVTDALRSDPSAAPPDLSAADVGAEVRPPPEVGRWAGCRLRASGRPPRDRRSRGARAPRRWRGGARARR